MTSLVDSSGESGRIIFANLERSMNLASIVGLIGAFAFISLGVDDLNGLIEASSVGLVVGGTTMVVLFRTTLEEATAALSAAGKVFIHKADEPQDLIDELIEIATVARKDGWRALERMELGNPFLAKGVRALVDGESTSFLRSMMEREMTMITKRHESGTTIFTAAGEIAPAMGMIGTLIGLVNLLSNLTDPSGIGAAMAIALLTTLYGAILANVVFIPMAMKLDSYARKEEINNDLIFEGILLVKANTNPRVLQDLLEVYLTPKKKGAQEDELEAELEAG